MQEYVFRPKGVCTVEIRFESDGEIVKNIRFTRGCNGNTKGLASLAEGMKVEDVVEKLKGTDCGGRGTSCPDQLATALEELVLSKK